MTKGGPLEKNRIGAGRLQRIYQILQVSLSFFFEGGPRSIGGRTTALEPAPASYVHEMLATRDGVALVGAFVRIDDPNLCIIDLVEAISAE